MPAFVALIPISLRNRLRGHSMLCPYNSRLHLQQTTDYKRLATSHKTHQIIAPLWSQCPRLWSQCRGLLPRIRPIRPHQIHQTGVYPACAALVAARGEEQTEPSLLFMRRLIRFECFLLQFFHKYIHDHGIKVLAGLCLYILQSLLPGPGPAVRTIAG